MALLAETSSAKTTACLCCHAIQCNIIHFGWALWRNSTCEHTCQQWYITSRENRTIWWFFFWIDIRNWNKLCARHKTCGEHTEHTMAISIWIEINSGNVFNCWSARAQIAFHFTSICSTRMVRTIANNFSCFTFTIIWNWCMARVAIDLFMQYYCALSTAGALAFLFVHSQRFIVAF